jgi:hypothetical protein
VATTTTTPTRLLHLFQILHLENSKRFSILLELKQIHSPFGKFKKFSILLDLKQILLHLENSKSFQFLWSSNWRLEPNKMLEPSTYVLQKSKHQIIGSC